MLRNKYFVYQPFHCGLKEMALGCYNHPLWPLESPPPNTKIQLTTLLQFLFSLKYQDVERTLKSLIKIITAQMICPIHAVKSDFSVKVSVVCHTWQWKCSREILQAAQMQIQSFVFAWSSAFVRSVFIVPLCSYGLSWWYFMMLCSNQISCS